MTIADIHNLIKNGESRTLELKKTTGELQDGMHSACAMLNSDGGYLIFGVTPSLKISGQQVTDELTPETIFLPHSSYPHNPLIAQVLYLTTFLDKWGSGVGRVMELCKEANAPAPFYSVGANEVMSTFPRPQNIAKSVSDSASQSVSGQQVVSKLAVSWQQVIETYSLDSSLTWDKIEPFLQQVKSPRVLKEILNELGYNDPYYFKKTFINPLIKAGIITMTIPDKPTSSSQKYVLTDKGIKLLSE